jgi:hypothetical protein
VLFQVAIKTQNKTFRTEREADSEQQAIADASALVLQMRDGPAISASATSMEPAQS